MKHERSHRSLGASLALAALVISGPANASFVLAGSDYFETAQPTFFIVPTGYPGAGSTVQVMGLPIGPGTTDTIVQRQADCSLNFNIVSDCTIPIEMVALSLVTEGPAPVLHFRESPLLASSGMMTIFSDGNPNGGGTFNSFFDIFIEFSADGGQNWGLFDWNLGNVGIDPLHLISTGTKWSTVEHGLLVDGLIGDVSANRHTDKVPFGDQFLCSITSTTFEICGDFYILEGGVVTEVDVVATHTAGVATVPAPAAVYLFLSALAGLVGMKRAARK